ncbi:MAG: N-acetylneuraminate synthase family protein [Planctomycetota bacterium]|nr:N-acetylneuraminate synthase family protein [Planctomycetota bacterium]
MTTANGVPHAGQRSLTRDGTPLIIAELGVNHDGSVECAMEMVRAAADAGADAVKFQLFRADTLMSKASRLAKYQAGAGETDPLAMLRRLELSAEQMKPAVELAHSRGMLAIVTVFSVELVAEAEQLAWDMYKSASPDVINRPLLEAMFATGKPLIVSTGAADEPEVVRAIDWLRQRTTSESDLHTRLGVLQCVSSYPTPIQQAALGGVHALRQRYAGPVGYSDHTAELDTGALAVMAGASILEKHFTHDRSAKGPDHAASLDAQGFARYVSITRRAFEARGPLIKAARELEQDVRHVSRQSLVATRDLAAGHVLTRADLTIKRPGTGLAPFLLDGVLGQPLKRAVGADLPLTSDDVTPRAL